MAGERWLCKVAWPWPAVKPVTVTRSNPRVKRYFHSNPDYALWYCWSEMGRDLTETREGAAALRAQRGKQNALVT
jgi:hypothetical protein